MAFTACTGDDTAATLVPTRPLVAFSPTPTRIPATNTPTPTSPPPAAALLASPTTPAQSPEAVLSTLVRADISLRANAPADTISQIRADAVYWPTQRLNCAIRPVTLEETRFPGFVFTYLALDRVYTYRTDTDDDILLCANYPIQEAPPDLLIEIDPVAAELVALAKLRLGRELDLPTEVIELRDLSAEIWENSNLGCVVDGDAGEPIAINGYRIVLIAAETEYIFHTDSVQLRRCEEAGD